MRPPHWTPSNCERFSVLFGCRSWNNAMHELVNERPPSVLHSQWTPAGKSDEPVESLCGVEEKMNQSDKKFDHI
jgi:hypothetical protein